MQFAHIFDAAGGAADPSHNPREAFYCSVSNCEMRGGESEMTYVCRDTQCYYMDHIYIPTGVVKIIESFTGECSFTCAAPDPNTGLMDCYIERMHIYLYCVMLSGG